MGKNSAIEWTDHTFNPWIGCTKVSQGCKHCYAETLMDKRYGRVKWGPAGTRSRTSEANWKKPFKWNRQAEEEGRRYRVFCASLADVFEDNPQVEEWREELLCGVIEQTPHLEWLLLTKRPENVLGMVPGNWLIEPGTLSVLPLKEGWPENVRIGTSASTQEALEERVSHLLQIPSPNLLSLEPLLERVNLWRFAPTDEGFGTLYDYRGTYPFYQAMGWPDKPIVRQKGIDWVIVGGESGHTARPMDVRWARDIVRQCRDAGVPVFVKQLGANPLWVYSPEGRGYQLKDKKGGDMSEWPEDLQVREFPAVKEVANG